MNNKTTTPKASAPETRTHSPVPWKIINGAIFDSAGRLVYASEEGNAQLIVAGVNQADKLAEALREAKQDLMAIQTDCDTGEFEIDPTFAIDRVTKALAEYEASRQ